LVALRPIAEEERPGHDNFDQQPVVRFGRPMTRPALETGF
jgi:hypothetical protein